MTLLLSVLYPENNHKVDQWYDFFLVGLGEEVYEKILKEVECAYSRS